jgi:addiction module HigA family antidote
MGRPQCPEPRIARQDAATGQWTFITQWRVCFRFEDGDAFDVEIVDYHWGKEVMTRKNLTTIHPGEFLAETLGELGLSQAAFARAIGVSPMRISHVVKGTRPVTAELALLFGRAFEQSPQYWLNLQSDHDLEVAGTRIGSRLRAIHSVTHA